MSTFRSQTEATPRPVVGSVRQPNTTEQRAVSVTRLLELQRLAGNRAVGQLLARLPQDAKLAQSSSETQPPVAWANTPPDLTRMSRVGLFDARNLIDNWLFRNSGRRTPRR